MENIEISNVVEYISAIQSLSNKCVQDSSEMLRKFIVDNRSLNEIEYIKTYNIDKENYYKEDYYIVNEKEYLNNLVSSFSIDDKINLKSFFRNYTSLATKHYKFFYRGHYRESYKLLPSVFRNMNWEKEDYYYHEIMVRCPEKFKNSSHLDRLVMMQHYGCPTRLLDVTSNPLVALYFACKKFGTQASKRGIVYMFPVLENDVVYPDSDKALMLSCLPKFSNKDKINLYMQCKDRIYDDNFSQYGSRYADNTVEHFYHEISTELPSFKREIKPIDLLRPLVVQPNKSNARILKQDGAFIISGLSYNENDALNKLKEISCEEIAICNHEGILKELEQLGIHEASLFPEVDRVANYLKEQ